MGRSHSREREEWSNWLLKQLPDDLEYVFVTLTLKQGLQRDDGTWEQLTREVADNELLFFRERINQQVFRNAYKRKQRCLNWIDCAEGGERGGKRAHRHLIVEKPSWLSDGQFQSLLIETWSRSRWSHKQFRIEPARDGNAIVRYMMKTGGDAICVSTLSIANKRPQTV